MGVNQARSRTRFELLAEQMDKCVDRVFFNFATAAPESVLNRLPGDDAAGISGQEFQKPEFRERKKNFAAAAECAKRRDVQDQVADFEDIAGFGDDATAQSAHPCKKLR